MTDIIFAIILLLAGLLITINKKFSWKNMDIDLSNNYLYIIIGGSLILFGILWLYSTIKPSISKNITEHTICPTCKQTYNYKDLEDGKCPTCEDTDTIDIDQYYKDNPFKEDEE